VNVGRLPDLPRDNSKKRAALRGTPALRFYWAGGGVRESALTVIELRTLNAVSVLR
jgi:hypothetical protein